jgi:hypothetical protein
VLRWSFAGSGNLRDEWQAGFAVKAENFCPRFRPIRQINFRRLPAAFDRPLDKHFQRELIDFPRSFGKNGFQCAFL